MVDVALLITSGQGKLFLYDLYSKQMQLLYACKSNNKYLMGLSRYGDKIFLGSNSDISEFTYDSKSLKFISNFTFRHDRFDTYLIRHIKVIGDKLFVPMYLLNGMLIIDIDKHCILSTISLKPSAPATSSDRLEDVFYHDNQFYFCMNSVAASRPTAKMSGDGGLVITDNNFNVLKAFHYGWDCYGFSIVDGDMYLLCNSNNKRLGGLVKNHSIKFAFSDIYCMDYSIGNDFITIVGGAINLNNSWMSGGIIIILDRSFELLDMKFIRGVGQFMGCLLLENDFTNNLENENISNLKLPEMKTVPWEHRFTDQL